MINPNEFRKSYGPWAVITGATDGTGSAFSRQLASVGINILLIARRSNLLSEVSEELRREYGVETRIASIDLYESGAGQRVIEAAKDLEVGLFVSNAGSDTNGSAFLNAPFLAWDNLMNRNIAALTEPCYAFAKGMVERGHGGIIIMSSGAALGGQPGGAIYSATKAFGLNFAESLWSELKTKGVDVLCAVCSAMNTPTLNTLLESRNLTVPGLLEPDDVIRTLLEKLGGGEPLHIFPFGGNEEETARIQKERIERLATMEQIAKMFYGEV